MQEPTIIIASLRITPEILALIAEIDEFKGAWRALGTLAPERLSALRRVATIESIGSSTRIEGSKLSDREVERLLADLEIKSFAGRDEQEVAGYAEVMELVFRSWQDITITENHIKQLHRDLLVYSKKDARHRGEYKTSSNSVAAFDKTGKQIGIVFATATPFDTPRLMTELITWFNQANDDRRLHPLLVIGIFTVVFLEIHPFQDGNGRLSRVLTTLLLLRAVCSLQLTRERGRAKQGTILSRAATDAGNDPHSCSQLGTLAAVFSFRPASADATTREKNRTGKAGAFKLAGSFRANLGSSSRTWAR